MSIALIKKFCKKVSDDDVFSLSAQFSYYIMLGIFPFLFLLSIIVGIYSNVLIDILNSFQSIMPASIYELFFTLLTDSSKNSQTSFLSLSLIVLLWSASSGSVGIIKGINKAYNTYEKKNYVFLKARGILFTIALMVSFQVVLVFVVIGENIISIITDLVTLPPTFHTSINIARHIFPIILLTIMFVGAYKFLPYTKITLKSTLPGSILSSIGCYVSSLAFSFYVNYRESYYDNIYGSLSDVFILFLWVYMISFVFLLGAQINAFIVREELTPKKLFNIKT